MTKGNYMIWLRLSHTKPDNCFLVPAKSMTKTFAFLMEVRVTMKKTGEVQKHPKGLASAKYDSRSAEFKQQQKQSKEGKERSGSDV